MIIISNKYVKNSYKLSGMTDEEKSNYLTFFYQTVNDMILAAANAHKDSITLSFLDYSTTINGHEISLTKEWFNSFIKDYQKSYTVSLSDSEGSIIVTVSGWSD